MRNNNPLRLIASMLLVQLSLNLSAQVDHVGDPKIPAHPRILMMKGEEAAVKNTISGDRIWGKLHQSILKECDNMIAMPVPDRIKIGRRLLDKSREAIRRLFFLSYAYRMTGQKKYRDRAEKEMLTIAGFSDW